VRRWTGVVGAAAIGAMAVAGCLPAAATAEGRDIGALYGAFVAIAAIVALIVFGFTTWSIVRYRRRSGDALPPQITGSWRLEALWTGVPVVTVLGLFVATLVVLGTVSATSDHPGARIRVEAFRWGWTFTYPDDGIRISGIGEPGPEVVVPVGEPILVTIASADVAHAFYVPQFLFKRDAIPGRESSFQFTVQDPGTYRGQCAEFCGIGHSRMPFALRAVPRAEYDAWLADQRAAGPSPSGPASPSPSPGPS
jgi:cytochrome c oxidase subunit II